MDDINVYGVVKDGKATLMCGGVPFKMEGMRPDVPVADVVRILKHIAIANRRMTQWATAKRNE